jgi:hypothetical protein
MLCMQAITARLSLVFFFYKKFKPNMRKGRGD